MVEQVKKRNGEIVIFDAKKIREAIHKANIAVADEKIPAKSLRELTDKVVGSLPAGQVPTVEQIMRDNKVDRSVAQDMLDAGLY